MELEQKNFIPRGYWYLNNSIHQFCYLNNMILEISPTVEPIVELYQNL